MNQWEKDLNKTSMKPLNIYTVMQYVHHCHETSILAILNSSMVNKVGVEVFERKVSTENRVIVNLHTELLQ